MRLAKPEPPANPAKIEVLEAFSYGCVHCFNFEPSMVAWRQKQPKDVDVQLLPATFNSNFAMFARGYYAAEALGVAQKLHEQVFDGIWSRQSEFNDFAAVADLYTRLGVDHEQFMIAARSPSIVIALQKATDKAARLRLDATPTLYVDGKYQVLLTGVNTFDEFVQRLDAVVLLARTEHKAPR